MKLWRVGAPVVIHGEVWRVVAKVGPSSDRTYDVMNFRSQRMVVRVTN